MAMMAGGGKGKPAASPAGAMPGAMPAGAMRPPADEEPMLRLYAERGGDVAVRAAQIILGAGLELADLHLAQPSLEDVFIHLTGKGLRD
jgi:ABC-2 type transport system ATP-binding protein